MNWPRRSTCRTFSELVWRNVRVCGGTHSVGGSGCRMIAPGIVVNAGSATIGESGIVRDAISVPMVSLFRVGDVVE